MLVKYGSFLLAVQCSEAMKHGVCHQTLFVCLSVCHTHIDA